MEEIVLVSDNHGQRKPLEYLKENYPITDYFIHCGDSEILSFTVRHNETISFSA